MRPILALAALVAASVAPSLVNGQKPPADPYVWRKSKTKAIDIARATDARMRALRNVEGKYDFRMIMKKGPGRSEGTIQYADPRSFVIEYPNVSYTRYRELDKVILRANGRGEAAKFSLQGGWGKKQPVANVRLGNPTSVADWGLGGPRFILSGFTGGAPLTDLVTRASRPGSGYIVGVRERTRQVRNRPVPQWEVTINRNPPATKKLGPFRLVLIVDQRQKLPVTLSALSKVPQYTATAIQFSLAWRSVKLSPATFQFPFETASKN